MASANDLLPDIAPESGDMPNVMIKRHIMNAARSFLSDSGVVREEITVSIPAGQEWTLFNPSDASLKVRGVIGVTCNGIPIHRASYPVNESLGGSPLAFQYSESQGIKVIPVQDEDIQVVVNAYLTLKQSATTIPDLLAESYRDGVIFGALYRIMGTKGGNWFDPQGSAYNQQRFQDEIVNAKASALTQHAGESLSVRRRRFI